MNQTKERLQKFRSIYQALYPVHTPEATGGIAALRLLLIEEVGEAEQQELIGRWGDEVDRRMEKEGRA